MKEEFDLQGQDFSNRGKRLTEMVEALRAMWGGGWVEFHGEYYDIPAVTMEPRGFVQVWAVGYYLEDGTLSTGFDLNRDGDALYLRTPSEERSQLCDDVTYPDQHEGVSFARYPDGGEWCYAAQATPGEENTGCF